MKAMQSFELLLRLAGFARETSGDQSTVGSPGRSQTDTMEGLH